MTRRFAFSVVTMILALAMFSASAQTPTTGQISGAVVDPSGAAVSGAKILVTLENGAQREATSDTAGLYRVPLLPPGACKISITAPGFQTLEATATIAVTETVELNSQLSISGGTEKITVAAEASVVQTTNATTGRVVGETQIRQLPLPTRNFQQLLTLSTGTVSNLSNNTEMGRGDATVYVNGQRGTSNNVVIDGTSVNSPGTNSTPNISVPSPDALQEFIVQTSMFDATQGRNSGGNVAVVTRGGTNEIHGSLFEFLRNRVFNANDFFLNSAGSPRPILTRNQFGGTVGGPIVKNKTFFFLSYQGTRERNGASLSSSLTFLNIPSGLTNDRSAAAINALNAAYYPGATPKAVSPIAVALLQAKLPDGSWAIPSAAGKAASLTTPVTTPISAVSRFDENQGLISIDHQITNSNRLSGRYFQSVTPQFQALFNFVGSNPYQAPGYGGNIEFHNIVGSINDTQIVTPSIINQFHAGFSRIDGPSTPQDPIRNSDVGINNPLCPTNPAFCGLSAIQVLGLFSVGSTTLADQRSTVNTFEFTDMISWNRGKHMIRAGGEFRDYRVDFFFNFFSRGQINFNSMADFLNGNVAFGLLGNGLRDRSYRSKEGAIYIQDDYKVNDWLTLNFGLRTQYMGGISETHGRLANFNPAQFPFSANCSVGAPCKGTTGFYTLAPGQTINPSEWALAPRFGFASRVSKQHNIALRGGFGVFDDRFSTRVANLQIFNYPYDIVGLGLGSFASPFPNLANVSFPVTPAQVPSPVPFYFAGIPLPTSPTPISGIYVSDNFHTPYNIQYNLSIQVEPFKNWLAEVGYTGSHGVKLINVTTLNQGTALSTAPYTPYGFSNNKALNGFQLAETTATSHYNSLQASLTKRFGHGLQMLASYTFSKSIDDASGAPTNEFAAVPGDQQNRSSNRGLSDFDRPQRFVLSGVYDFPAFYQGSSKAAKVLLNNWQTAGIVTLQAGAPYSAVCVSGSTLYNRADYIGGNVAGSGRIYNQINAAAFSPICANVAPFGTSGRNILRGPGQRNTDWSFVKMVPVRERMKFELRGELFNVFNNVNFAQPNNNVLVPSTFGKITASAAGPRVVQFGAKFTF